MGSDALGHGRGDRSDRWRSNLYVEFGGLMRDRFISNKGGGTFKPMAQGTTVLNTNRETNKWMSNQKQLCWKCQKDSIPERGCELQLRIGLKKYICKPCVDSRSKA